MTVSADDARPDDVRPGDRASEMACELPVAHKGVWIAETELGLAGAFVTAFSAGLSGRDAEETARNRARVSAAIAEALAACPLAAAAIHVGSDGPGFAPAAARPVIEEIDLSAYGKLARRRFDTIARRFADRPFDLARGPLARAAVVRLSDQALRVIFVFHQLACDRLGIGAVAARFRAGLRDGLEAPDEAGLEIGQDLAARLSAGLAAERAYLAGPGHDEDVAWWCGTLDALPPPPALPADRPRTGGIARACQGVERRLRAEDYTSFYEAVDEHDCAPEDLIAAAAALLYYRYSGAPSFLPLLEMTAQAPGEASALPGLRPVPLSVPLDPERRLADLVADVRERRAAAAAHARLPFARLVAAVSPEAQAQRAPLSGVCLSYTPLDMSCGDVALIPAARSPYELAWRVLDDGRDMRLTLEYNEALFEPSYAELLAGHLITALNLVTRAWHDPEESRLKDIDLMSDHERWQLTEGVNATAEAFPEEACLHSLFEARAEELPDWPAVTADGVTLSYRDLNARANRICRVLQGAGAGRGSIVGVCLPRTADLAATLIAISKCGAAYLPLDPSYPEARLRFMLADSGADVVVTADPLRGLFSKTAARVIAADDWADTDADASNPEVRVSPEDLFYVIYTSGSTGEPKGVLLNHRGRTNNFTDFNRRFGIGPGDAVLGVSPVSFDMCAYDVFGTLAAGAHLVLGETGAQADVRRWAAQMRDHAITVWHSAPALLELLTERLERNGTVLPALRLVLLGGDWIPLSLPDRIRARCGGPAQIVSLGGATECSMDSTIYDIRQVAPHWLSIPYGRPMANQRAYVLDAALRPQPVNVPGELYLGGIGVGEGYLNRPEITAERFLRDPFARPDGGERAPRMYRTGDIARWRPDGELELLGRADFQVKLHGHRIELGEIEKCLRDHDAVAEGVVTLARPERGSPFLAAYVVWRQDDGPADAALRRHLEAQLPAYMVPAVIVTIDALPLSPNGKVDRRALPVPSGEDDAVPVAIPAAIPVAVPRPSGKARVPAELVAQLGATVAAGLGRESIDPDTDYLEEGMDSYAALRIVQDLPNEVSVVDLLTNRTVRTLAAQIDAIYGEEGYLSFAAGDEAPDLVVLCEEGVLRTAPDQRARAGGTLEGAALARILARGTGKPVLVYCIHRYGDGLHAALARLIARPRPPAIIACFGSGEVLGPLGSRLRRLGGDVQFLHLAEPADAAAAAVRIATVAAQRQH